MLQSVNMIGSNCTIIHIHLAVENYTRKMTESQFILTFKNLRFGFGEEEIIHIDNLKISANTITALLGPSGSGKSSLMNAIKKQNFAPSYWEKGEIFLQETSIKKNLAQQYIGYVPQKARLYTDTILNNLVDGIPLIKKASTEKKINFAKKTFQSLDIWPLFENIIEEPAIKQSLGIHKIVLIARAFIKKPKVLLIDEILASTSVKDEEIIIDIIKKLKKHTTILLITHNKDEAKKLCDSIALVSGGILHEHTENEQFFKCPISDIGKEFLESGSAWYTNPNPQFRPKEDLLTTLRRFSSMCDFHWIVANRLGGMQKPGLINNIDEDLETMKKLKIDTLISLQQKPIETQLLKKFNITGIHFPIMDMGIPDLQTTYDFFFGINDLIKQNKSIVYHCKAGMGRTGTMLACHLIWVDQISAIHAIEEIRHINYKYIQTREQAHFVKQFEDHIEHSRHAKIS